MKTDHNLFEKWGRNRAWGACRR